MKTKQETFDTVVKALLAQGKPARLASHGVCRYRGDDGCKCAVGHLIPDDKYDPVIEGASVRTARVVGNQYMQPGVCLGPKLLIKILKEEGHDLQLCQDLQGAHDNGYAEPEHWMRVFRDRARDIADAHELDASVLA